MSLTKVLLPKPFTMILIPTSLMILLRRESLKSDNSDEEAHDESDESIATQTVHNDTTTVEKVMQHFKQEIYWKCT